jgi:AcrR family transcriptional regulator
VVAISRPSGEERASSGEASAKGLSRRDAIIEAATELFAERGYNGVSVQEIADAAGTHKTTVLYHFDTKDALHEAVLEQALGKVAEIQREFLAGPFVRERVGFLIDQIHNFYAEHPSLARLLQRELLEPAGNEAYIKLFVDPIYVPAMKSFQRAIERGLIRKIDPALFIHDTHVTLIGYFCHRPLLERLQPGVDPYSVDALIARREYLVDQIFAQLTPV